MAECNSNQSHANGPDEVKSNPEPKLNGTASSEPKQLRKKRNTIYVPSRYKESAIAYAYQRQTYKKTETTWASETTVLETKSAEESKANKLFGSKTSTPKKRNRLNIDGNQLAPGLTEVSTICSGASGATKERREEFPKRSTRFHIKKDIKWDFTSPMDRLIVETQHLLANYQARKSTSMLVDQAESQKAILNNLMMENVALSDQWSATAKKVDHREQTLCRCDYLEKIENVCKVLIDAFGIAADLKDSASQKDYNRLFYKNMDIPRSSFSYEDDLAKRLDRLVISEHCIADEKWKVLYEMMSTFRDLSKTPEGHSMDDFIARLCCRCKTITNAVSRKLSILLDAKAKRDRRAPTELNRELYNW